MLTSSGNRPQHPVEIIGTASQIRWGAQHTDFISLRRNSNPGFKVAPTGYASPVTLAYLTSHIVSTKDQDRSWQYLKETHHRFRELVRSGDSFINRPFLLSLLKCVLTVLWSNQKTLTFLDIEDLYASRARYFQTLVSDINVLHNERESRTSSLSNSPNLLVAAVSDVPGLDGLATWDFG